MSEQTINRFNLSNSQKRLWLMGVHATRSFKRSVVRIKGALDIERLRSAISSVVKRHGILRTTYVSSAEFILPFQSIEEGGADFKFSYADSSGDGLTMEDVCNDYSTAGGTVGCLDLQNENPLITQVIQLGPQDQALVILLPSMAADSYSIKNMVGEIAAVYADPDAGQAESGIQYFHFSEWQNDLLEIGSEEAVDFWKKYDYLNNNALSISFCRNMEGVSRDKAGFSLSRRVIDGRLTAAIRELSVRLNTDVSIVIAACFSALMQHHTRKDTFTVGFVNNTRGYEELQPVIGLVAQTLPLIVGINSGSTFISLIRSMEEELEKIVAREDYFGWGTDINDREGNDNSWFRLEFEYLRIEEITAVAGQAVFSVEQLISVNGRFDLKLSCLDFGDRIELDFYHDRESLPDDAADILADQYQALLSSAMAAPDMPLDKLRILSKKESHAITAVFNRPESKDVPGPTVVGVFENMQKRNGDAIAVKYEGIELTYSVLEAKANQVANYLKEECNIRPGDTVALSMPRSEKLIIAMLGILKAGACYLPIDNGFPEGRVRFMLEDCEARVIITSKGIPDLSIIQILYTESISSFEYADTVAPAVDISAEHPVYIIYTSGSTGVPKGVAIANSSLLNYCSWFLEKSGLGKQSSTLLLSSVAFDLCYTSLWTSLLSGHTLCILKETEYMESGEIIRKLVEYKIDYIKLTPSHFNIIINDPDFESNGPAYNLSLIVLGGEEINLDDVAAYFRVRPDVRILQHYGPTETTVGTIAQLINFRDFGVFKRKIVLGKPITNNSVYIVDAENELCPIGFPGELVIGGRGLALGYLNRPDLNRSKFIRNPFKENSTVYLTGDLGRWMPDGTIEFLGRKDNQLKIRGYRIELGEIENTILKNEQVKSAVVLPCKKGKGDVKLVAYLLSGNKFSNEKMNIILGKFLPPYMIPDRFVWLDVFPLTPNGKVDKKALTDLALSDEMAFSYIPPVTVLEKKMALIWREVLGKVKIGISDDFFKLGGHSLKATQLISRVFRNLGFRIKLSDIFENPTIEALLKVILNSSQIKYEPIAAVDTQAYYDVSHAQKRLWFLDQFEENQSAYNMHFAFWVNGDLKIQALKKAFELVLRRHESLRSTFLIVGGIPKQKINVYEDFNFELEVIDLTKEADPEAIAEKYSKKAMDYIFSLKDGPILRATLLQLKEGSFAFLLTMHHIISDGWSMRVLMNEIMIAYNICCNAPKHPTFLEPLRIQYKDYAAWHNKVISGPEEAYWNRKINNPPALVSLPYEKVSVTEADGEKPYRSHELDKETTQALRDLAKEYHSTLSNLVLTVYALFLNKITGQTDFLIGVGHANRNHADLEGLIGFFVNLLAIRVQFSEDATIESMIKDISQSCIEAYDHSNYPFDLLVEKFCNDRYSTRQPLVNVMYDFKGYSDLMLENEGYIDDDILRVTEMPRLRNMPKFDMTIFVMEIDDGLRYFFEYNNKLFSESTINNFFKVFNELIMLIRKKDTAVYN